MYNFLDFTKKTVVVAGASSGIGRQIAITLSRLDGRVVLIARREEQLKETIAMMEGNNHLYYPADLNNVDEIDALIKKVVVDVGSIDGLAYCAGISRPRPLRVVSPEALENMMKINFFSFYEMVRSATKKGNYNKGMRIVGLSSTASPMGGKGQSAYSASKAAMDATVHVLAQELADKDICINTIRAGMTDTDMYKGFLKARGEEGKEYLLTKQILGIANVQDIANAAVYLLSPKARFITGANIAVDGGYTCH